MSGFSRPWRLREADPIAIEALADSYGISTLLARLLVVRGLVDPADVNEFLHAADFPGHDPDLFSEIDAAIERILSAVESGERVLVHGDYDVDGLTGTAIVVETLRDLGLQADYYIPHRLLDGYGIQASKVAEVAERYSLLITVDCGTQAYEALDLAAEKGLDVIVTDHHEPGNTRPNCLAILNPGRPEDRYPWPNLSGSAVAWKLCQALRDATGILAPPEKSGIDLAALGTVADIVPLLGENRGLVTKALPILRQQPRMGIRALLEVSGSKLANLDTQTIGFRIGPRLNALGRLADSFDAIELLLTDNEARANEIASQMDDLNRQRQAVERRVCQEAIDRVEQEGLAEGDSPLLCVAGEDWHQGVVGIVASRLVDRYHRPAIVMSIEDGELHGSGRSVEGRNLASVVEAVRDLLNSGGGHEMAVGLSASLANLDRLKSSLIAAAREQWGGEIELPPLWIDAELPIERASLDLLDEIEKLAPFGNGNPQPLFSSKARVSGYGGQVVGNNHLRFKLEHQRGLISAVAFGQGHHMDRLSTGAVEVAYQVDRNSYQGRSEAQLVVKAIRPIDPSSLPANTLNVSESDSAPVAKKQSPPEKETRPVKQQTSVTRRQFRCVLDRPTVGHVWKMIEKMETERGVDTEILAGLLRMRGIDPEKVQAAIQVLEELALLVRAGTMVQQRPAATKRDLMDSPTFRELSQTAS